jgi:phage terminase small subunit
MPRISTEARAAALWRHKPEQLTPPSYLSPDAKKLWREVVASRPSDYFRPGSLQLLEQFCETMVAQRWALALLATATKSGDLAAVRAATQIAKTLAAIVNSTSIKLRISAQAEIARRSGLLNEPGAEPDPLLGGLRPVN